MFTSSSYVRFTGKGNSNDQSVFIDDGVHPIISLKYRIEYRDGDGSMANPYVVTD